MKEIVMAERVNTYEKAYRQSISNPEEFWGNSATAIEWYSSWETVLDRSRPPFYRWFPGATVNICYNSLDRHVLSGKGDHIALIWDSPVTNSQCTYTYRTLCDIVARFAGGLTALGVEKGDRVIIYMPMVPEAVIGMLACARIGAIHSVVFGGFAPNELATRIRDAEPKVILSASCGIEVNRIIPYKHLLDEAIEISGYIPSRCIILQRPALMADLQNPRDIAWDKLSESEPVDCLPVSSTDPLYILYTSGTTGIPKGVVRDTGGHAVALYWSMKAIYGINQGEVFWAASDIGWVVGHSYIVYGPLLAGCTTILYEGKSVGTPDAGSFWRVISRHGVNVLFTAPTAFRAIRREDPDGDYITRYDLSSLRTLFLAGERCDPETLRWAEEKLHIPVIDHWWQTETGWPIGSNPVGMTLLPVKPGSCTKPVPGYDIYVLDDHNQEVPPGIHGNIAIKLPLPPGCFLTLWNNDADYVKTYMSTYPGYYITSDAGFIDKDGYLWIMGRTDDIINVAGHRLSTGSMEEVLAAHPDVAECAVVGVHDTIKSEIPIGFVVLKSGISRGHNLIEKELIQQIRDRIGPIASFKTALIVKRLPKTRSGKVLRGTMKKIANGVNFRIPATIDEPEVLTEIKAELDRKGFPRN
jgi:propionyl-CoA synthetase